MESLLDQKIIYYFTFILISNVIIITVLIIPLLNQDKCYTFFASKLSQLKITVKIQ
jgi:hypothetical protein